MTFLKRDCSRNGSGRARYRRYRVTHLNNGTSHRFPNVLGWPEDQHRFSELEGADGKRLICTITNVPIKNVVLQRLGVRRDPAMVSADFHILEVGTNRLIVDTAQARLFDPADDRAGSFHATVASHLPLFFTCLVHMKDNQVYSVGGLSGRPAIILPTGRYVVDVRVICGHAEFSRSRQVAVGTSPPYTAWLGS
jgi:hypothetical protein